MNYQSSNFRKISFLVLTNKHDAIYCKTCNLNVMVGEIRIVEYPWFNESARFPHSHLHCFTPILKQSIRRQDITIKLTEEHLQVFEDWLNSWNKNYHCDDYLPESKNYSVQTFFIKKSKRIRTLLEVFKFLSLKDILASVVYVNKEFYSVAWNRELWEYLNYRDFGIVKFYDNPKHLYIFHYATICDDCLKLFKVSNLYRCPVLVKNLCHNCFHQNKYEILDENQIKRLWGINISKLDVVSGTIDGHQKACYLEMFEQSLKRFRTKQKEDLLIMIINVNDQHPIINDVLNIDILNMEKEVSPIERKHKRPSHRYSGGIFQSIIPHPESESEFFNVLFEFIRSGNVNVTEMILMKELNKS